MTLMKQRPLRAIGLGAIGIGLALTIVGERSTEGAARGDHLSAWARPTPVPVPVRVLPQGVDGPVLHHTATLLGPHDPKDVIGLYIGVSPSARPGATEVIVVWTRLSGFTVTDYAIYGFVGVKASTALIERVLRLHVNDYRLPHGYTFRANDRPPTVPASLSILAISGLSTYVRTSPLPGPVLLTTPTPYP